MGNIGDTISESAPAVGSAGPTYASTINALLTEFKARLVARIPLSALLANSNLDMNGQAILNAAYITLTNEAVSPSGVASPSNRIAAYNGNLWWVSPTGAVQLTNGASLNASGIGGITGDYSGAGPMEFRYDLANTRYDAFANQSTNTWAYVRGRGFDIAQTSTSNLRTRLTAQAGSGSSQSFSLPAAPPSSPGAVMIMDNSGNMSASNSLYTSINLATGDYKHTDMRVVSQDGSGGACTVGTYSSGATSDAVTWTLSTGGGVVYIPLRGLRENDRIRYIGIAADATSAPTVELYSLIGGTATLVPWTAGAWTYPANGGRVYTIDTPTAITLQGSTATLFSSETYFIKITSNASTVTVRQINILFDRL